MRRGVLTSAFVLAWAHGAYADVAVLRNGATFKISGQRIEGETAFLTLKDGGEVGVPVSAVQGVVPDEVVEELLEQVAAPLPASTDLRALATEAARRHGLDPALVLAVVSVESGFRPDAVSPKGAQGLMQLMPATASSLGVRDPLDPAANLDGGTRYLGWLLSRYDGDLRRALAAYNAGPGAVQRHGGPPPYRETREYLRKVLGRYQELR